MKQRTLPQLLLSFLAVLVAVGLPLCALFGFRLDNTKLTLHDVADYNDGWLQVTPRGDRAMTHVPHMLAVQRGTVTLKNALPEIRSHDMALFFRTNGESVVASVDGEVVYTLGQNDEMRFGSHSGPVWCLIPLPEGEAGRELTLTLIARNTQSDGSCYNFQLDNRNSLLLSFVIEHSFVLLNSLLGIVTGLVLIFNALYRHFRSSSMAAPRMFLGQTTLLASAWAFADCGLMQLLSVNAAFGYLASHTLFYLAGAPFAMLLATLLPRYFRLFRALSISFCAVFLIASAVYVLGIAEFNQMLFAEHALLMVCAVLAVGACLRSRKNHSGRMMLVGSVGFALFALMALARFYLSPYLQFPTSADLILAGMDILVVCCYLSLTHYTIRIDANASRYERQAYTDGLTGVGNRAALEMRLTELDPHIHMPMAVFMVDLNNLKLVNDTLGHEIGDVLIRSLVECLRITFRDSGEIYRFGGDEFVILIDRFTSADAQSAKECLERTIAEANGRGGCVIDAASGYAVRGPGDGEGATAHELLRAADTFMYELKQQQKADSPLPTLTRQFLLGSMDPLTGLLTFDSFRRRVHERLDVPDHPRMAIISFDVNHFDGYNSLFGWSEGDNLLKRLADVAIRLCGEGGFCAHSDADMFWVLVNFEDPERVYARIRDEFARFDRQMLQIKLFLSFGLYAIDETNIPVREMCNRARIAKGTVKGRFNQLYALYNTDEHQSRVAKLRLTGYMPLGLDKNEFRAYYQPLMSLKTGEITSAEALVRWVHADGTTTPPGEFIDLFEKNGLLLKLDISMFERVCRSQRRRMALGMRCVPVSVNLSRLHAFTRNGAKTFRTIVDDYELPVELIRVELTETAFTTDEEQVYDFVDALRLEGFQVLMDDFGSGMSSLGQLNHLALDGIKLDRSFLIDSYELSMGRLMVESILFICRRAGMLTIAEGVETQEHLDFLKIQGCDMVQGNLISLPLSEEDFDALLGGPRP